MVNRDNETRENAQNKNKEGSTSKNFITGAVIGGVVGAAAALFLTPKSGKEIRNELNNQVNNLFDRTTGLSDDIIEKSNSLAAVTKEKTSLISKAVVQQSKELVNKAKGLSVNETGQQGEEETSYISIGNSVDKSALAKDGDTIPTLGQETDIRKKLEEAQKAFDEAENSIIK